jgi:NAD(P)-dependent dehydrogenase (short-subunit alcohol dehydrogenase family)
VTPDGLHGQFDTNVLGPILATQEAVKQFEPEGGSAVNISSIVSIEPHPYTLIYSATKAAVDNNFSTHWASTKPMSLGLTAAAAFLRYSPPSIQSA